MSEGREPATAPLLPAPLADPPASRRWCPYCGADLSGVPVDRDDAAATAEAKDEAVFAVAGRRLKTAIAVAFVLMWLGVSLYDWLNDPSTPLIPGWFSALGAFMLFYLLGIDMLGLIRRRH